MPRGTAQKKKVPNFFVLAAEKVNLEVRMPGVFSKIIQTAFVRRSQIVQAVGVWLVLVS